jgi:DNA-binding response OmpR family regulator
MTSEVVMVVEDETSLRETLAYNLEQQGYQVYAVGDGAEALKLARAVQPDLIVMDIMLPGMDGMDVTRRLRAEANVPVLMLTARDDEIDRVLGLEIGADDYMTKPFSMREFLARVKAILRRVELTRDEMGQDAIPEKDVLEFDDLIIDDARHEVRLRDKVIALKPKEYDLLLFFARHPGQVLSRALILERVWGWEFGGGTRTVDVHMRWLRAKLEKAPGQPVRFITVRGTGYRFEG